MSESGGFDCSLSMAGIGAESCETGPAPGSGAQMQALNTEISRSGQVRPGAGYAWFAFMPRFAGVARYQSSIQLRDCGDNRLRLLERDRQRFQRDADLRRRHITAGS